jgi:hypothetical protein
MSTITEALIVGAIAFAGMITAAGGCAGSPRGRTATVKSDFRHKISQLLTNRLAEPL